MKSRVLSLGALGLLCAATASATALGDGGPAPGVVQGWDGLARGTVRYVAIPTSRTTIFEKISRKTGRVLRWAVIPGSYGVPQVAFDGSIDGLSKDGRTFVLGDIVSNPQLKRSSSFAVIDVPRTRLRATIKLQGDFSFDALSPGARMLYLIEHVSNQNVREYRVRAYDLGARRLLERVVIDKTSWEEVMQGVPFTRETSRTGRWVYTLYAGGEHPFVHALDTQNANARCIDLPRSWNDLDIGRMRLNLGRGQLLVRDRAGGRPLAVVDVKTLRVSRLVRNP